MKYKEILESVQPHFGGSGTTSTMGAIAPELRNLYTSSADALVGQQGDNPLGQCNESNPLEVAGPDPLQNEAIDIFRQGNQPTGIDALAMQSILRMTGLAGAGPTTGQYDYGAEAGLGDYARFMSPDFDTRSLPGNLAPDGGPETNNFSDLTAALAARSPTAPRPGAPPGPQAPPTPGTTPGQPPAPPGGGGGRTPTGERRQATARAGHWSTLTPTGPSGTGPGGLQYTGSQHEFSGGLPEDVLANVRAATGTAAGHNVANAPEYQQFLANVNAEQRARADSTMTPDTWTGLDAPRGQAPAGAAQAAWGTAQRRAAAAPRMSDLRRT